MARLPILVAAIRLIVYSVLSIVIISRLEEDAADGETFLIFIVAIAAVFELIGTVIGEASDEWGAWFHVFAFVLVASIEIAIIAGATFAVKFNQGVLEEREAFQPVAYTISAIALLIGVVSLVTVLVRWFLRK